MDSPATFIEQARARLKEIGRNLRHVETFRKRLEARFPKSRRPRVSISMVDGKIQVEVSGKYTAKQHPYTVDEAIQEAAKGTKFWDNFHVAGVGTDCQARRRDNTFWEGPGDDDPNPTFYDCECGHYVMRYADQTHWCAACGRLATVEDDAVVSWWVPNHKLEGVSRQDEVEEEKRLMAQMN